MSSLIGVMVATLVALMILPRYFGMVENGTTQAIRATTAGQFQALLTGAQKYIDKHATELTGSVPVGGTSTIDIATLVAENDLPPGFGTENPYRQTWQVYVRQPATGTLDALVESTGVATLSSRDSVAIASLTGAHGGFVPEDGMFGSMSSGNAYGASGSWQLPLGNPLNPGPGHLVGLLASANMPTDTTDYLYRDAVPNHPELNTMRTALSMGGNDITNANNVNATRGIFNGGNPNGGYGGVKVGSAYLYGDDRNAAIRAPDRIFMQHYDGSPADLSAQQGFFGGNIGTRGYDPVNGLPNGWWGGVHSFDGYFEGTLAAGSGGALASYMNSRGYARIGDHLDIQNYAWVATPGCAYNVGTACLFGDNTNAAVRTPGTVYMQHGDGSKADFNAGNADFTTVNPGTANGTAWPGNGCSPTGAIAAKADGSGQLLSCMAGVWRIPPAQVSGYVPTTTNGWTNYNIVNNITGTYSCPAGTADIGVETIWYGSGGYSQLHLCSAQ